MKTFVFDASVLAKLIFPEEEFSELVENLVVQYINEQVDIVVPSLMYFEIGNILKFKLKDTQKAKTYMQNIRDLHLHEYKINDEAENKILTLCSKYEKISFYDASYHGIAKHLNYTFITADSKYFNMVKKEGNIQLLNTMKTS